MTKINTLVSLAVAGLMLSAGAQAAGFPASGEAPLFAQPVAASSMLQRADVRLSPADQLPLAGNVPSANGQAAGDLERADVRTQAAQHLPAAGEANAAA